MLGKSKRSHVLVHVVLTGILVSAVVLESEVVVLGCRPLVVSAVHGGGVKVCEGTLKRRSNHVVYEVYVYIGSISCATGSLTVDVLDVVTPAVVTAVGKILILNRDTGCLGSCGISVLNIVINSGVITKLALFKNTREVSL